MTEEKNTDNTIKPEGNHPIPSDGNTDDSENVTSTEASKDTTENTVETGDMIGRVVEGSITHITHFGAFVKIENGEEGMVHISEVANEYVTDINTFVSIGDKIKVKVLNRNDKGKLELSIKRSKTTEEKPALFIRQKTKNSEFEQKISHFLKKSEEKQIDIRRNMKNKQGITKKRR